MRLPSPLRRRLRAGCGLALAAMLVWLCMSAWPISLQLLRFYPKKAGSAVAGWLANRTLSPGMRKTVLGRFAAHYRIRLDEAEFPLEHYPSLQAFFTRRLRPGLRPQEALVPGSVNSPVDARIIACGRIEKDTVLQAKGLPYRVSELLRHDPDAARFEGGHYLTLYLSPQDYHRIHVPIPGQVRWVGRVEGELWPVNDASTNHVPRLYERNRRAMWAAMGTGEAEGLEVAAIPVGATHVGGVVLDRRWLNGKTLPKDGAFAVPDLPCAPGDDLGTFEFGSTVVLLIGGPGAADWAPLRTEGPVKVGQRLGARR